MGRNLREIIETQPADEDLLTGGEPQGWRGWWLKPQSIRADAPDSKPGQAISGDQSGLPPIQPHRLIQQAVGIARRLQRHFHQAGGGFFQLQFGVGRRRLPAHHGLPGSLIPA